MLETPYHSFELVLLGILGSVFLYSLLTNVIEKTILTLPLVFMVVDFSVRNRLCALAIPTC